MGRSGAVDPSTAGRTRMLLVDLTPDLVGLLRRSFPGSDVWLAAEGDELDELLTATWDVIVVDLDTVHLGQILPQAGRIPVVGVTSSAERAADRGELAAVLPRPVLGDDLRRTVGRLLGDDETVSPAERRFAGASSKLPIARSVALGLGLLMELAGGDPRRWMLLTVAVVLLSGVTARMRTHGATAAAHGLDLAVAVVLLASTGGAHSSFVLFALAIIAGAGLSLGARAAASSTVCLLVAAGAGGIATADEPVAAATWVAVVVLLSSVAVIAMLVRQLWSPDPESPSTDLRDAHRALRTLAMVAERQPCGLALPDAAGALLRELTRRWRASAAVVLVEQDGALLECGSTGLTPHAAVVLLPSDPIASASLERHASRTVADALLPAVLRLSTSTSEPWTLTPLSHEGAVVGALLWTGPHHLHERHRIELRSLSRRGGLAIATARRFEHLRSASADRDRERLRGILGEDVFQNVISLRYEIELLARRADARTLRPQLDRLGALARDVAAEVRLAADGLGSEVGACGLGAALRRHCRDLERLVAVRIEVDLQTRRRTDRDAEAVTYELATTAIHRAIARPGVTRIDVRSVERDGVTVVEIDDDGTPAADGDGELRRMAGGASEFGVSVCLSASARGNLVLITAAAMERPRGGVS